MESTHESPQELADESQNGEATSPPEVPDRIRQRETEGDDRLEQPQRAPAGPRREGDDLLSAAAKGDPLSGEEIEDATKLFLDAGEAPGKGKTDEIPVKLEWGGRERTMKFVIRPIDWVEWKDAEKRATPKEQRSALMDGPDEYVMGSHIVARALLEPQLAGVLKARRESGEEDLVDIAHLLRRTFANQSGVLLAISSEVIKLSKLGGGDDVIDRKPDEGEAAKN